MPNKNYPGMLSSILMASVLMASSSTATQASGSVEPLQVSDNDREKIMRKNGLTPHRFCNESGETVIWALNEKSALKKYKKLLAKTK